MSILSGNLLRYIYYKVRFRQSVVVYGARVSRDSEIGDGVKILERCTIGSSKIGRYCYVGNDSIILRTSTGPFCSIGSDVRCGLGKHPVHYASTYPGFYSSQAGGAHFFGNSTDFAEHLPVKIEADVWIGTGAMILGGVSIGIGSVIAAGAIVSKPVPDYAIVGGVPAKIIRFRFDQDLRAELKSSRWWELGIEELNSLARFITAPQQFAAEAARLNA